jgi:uncharacterized protein YecE (DUF72 family)
LPLAVEVRNNSWLAPGNAEKFYSVLKRENIAYVSVDEPDIGWTVGHEWPLTAEWGTVARFHGRNRAGWSNSRASVHERFDYEYSREELEELLERIKAAAGSNGSNGAKLLYLMYNNCVGDKAVKAAMLMKEMLGLWDAPLHVSFQKNIF